MPLRNNYRKAFTLLSMLIFLIGCNSKDKKLEAYYANNTKLHQELSDSLMEFSKKYKRKITLRKTHFADQHIRVDISFPERAESLPIFFDSAYNRRDYNEKTSGFTIPKGLIVNFANTIYFGIGSDSSYTFFAYEWDRPKDLIGTSGDSQYGILILKDTIELNKKNKKLSENACITSYGVF